MDPTKNENLAIGFINARWRDSARSLEGKDRSIPLEANNYTDDAHVHISAGLTTPHRAARRVTAVRLKQIQVTGSLTASITGS
jgi:hypothetical protein